jgi:hypothetical protein
VRFDGVATSGRNRPLRVAVETSDGQEHDTYLKASGRPELGIEGLANELLAACLAGDLRLPITEPFLVELGADWIASVSDVESRRMLEHSVPVAFGSTAAGTQWNLWSAADRVTAARQPTALEILAFDAFIANDDRKPGQHANCLVKGDELRIFDHELAFRLAQKLFPRPEPWKVGYLARLVQPDGHLFGAILKGKTLDFGRVRQAWRALTEAHLKDYLTQQPTEWAPAQGAMNTAVAHIRSVRDRIDDCVAELQRALT